MERYVVSSSTSAKGYEVQPLGGKPPWRAGPLRGYDKMIRVVTRVILALAGGLGGEGPPSNLIPGFDSHKENTWGRGSRGIRSPCNKEYKLINQKE